MIRHSKWFVPAMVVLTVGFWLDASASKAGEVLIGAVSGTVTDKDGQKLEGVKVRIIKPRERGEGQGREGARRPNGDRSAAGPADAPPRPDGDRPGNDTGAPPKPGNDGPPPGNDAPRPPAGDGPANRSPNAGGPDGGDRPRRGGPGEGDGRRQPPIPSAEGYTDKDGNFTLNVPAGEYVAVVMERDKGFAHVPVTVEAEKTATVSLKLEDRPAGDAPRREGGDRQGRDQGRPGNDNSDQPRGERPPKPE